MGSKKWDLRDKDLPNLCIININIYFKKCENSICVIEII